MCAFAVEAATQAFTYAGGSPRKQVESCLMPQVEFTVCELPEHFSVGMPLDTRVAPLNAGQPVTLFLSRC